MLEQQRSRREERDWGPSDGSIFSTSQPDNLVTVSNGPYDGDVFPVAGMTVAAIRDRLADRLDLEPTARAFVDGQDADDQLVLEAGQVLSFMQHAGEKGVTGVTYEPDARTKGATP